MGRSWNPSPTTTVWICQRLSGRTLRTVWVSTYSTNTSCKRTHRFKAQTNRNGYPALSVQLRTSMVKGETGTLTLDVRAAVDKGVSVFASAILYVKNIKLLEVLLFVRFILLIPKHTGRFSAVPDERLTSWNNRGDFCDRGSIVTVVRCRTVREVQRQPLSWFCDHR